LQRVRNGLAPGEHKGGPHRVIDWKVEMSIKILLESMPWYYLDEIKEFLSEAYNIDVSIPTVSRALKKINITRKRLRVEAAQRNEKLRICWQNDLQFLSTEQLVYIDESGSDERTGDRLYSWAEKGARAVVQRYLQSRERISVLASYTIEGYIAASTFSGTCTADIFEEYANTLIFLCEN